MFNRAQVHRRTENRSREIGHDETIVRRRLSFELPQHFRGIRSGVDSNVETQARRLPLEFPVSGNCRRDIERDVISPRDLVHAREHRLHPKEFRSFASEGNVAHQACSGFERMLAGDRRQRAVYQALSFDMKS